MALHKKVFKGLVLIGLSRVIVLLKKRYMQRR